MFTVTIFNPPVHSDSRGNRYPIKGFCDNTTGGKLHVSRYIHTWAERTQAENWLQHKSLHVFTHVRSRSGGGVGAKSAHQQMGPTPNFPRPLRNHALQTICGLKKWQIRSHPLRICVNIPTVAERECQNRPVSALQPLRAYVNVALELTWAHLLHEGLVSSVFSFWRLLVQVLVSAAVIAIKFWIPFAQFSISIFLISFFSSTSFNSSSNSSFWNWNRFDPNPACNGLAPNW